MECDELLWGVSSHSKPLEVISSWECSMHCWCVSLILEIQLVINAISHTKPTHICYTPTFGGLCHGIAIDTRCHCSCNLRAREKLIECVRVVFQRLERQFGETEGSNKEWGREQPSKPKSWRGGERKRLIFMPTVVSNWFKSPPDSLHGAGAKQHLKLDKTLQQAPLEPNIKNSSRPHKPWLGSSEFISLGCLGINAIKGQTP